MVCGLTDDSYHRILIFMYRFSAISRLTDVFMTFLMVTLFLVSIGNDIRPTGLSGRSTQRLGFECTLNSILLHTLTNELAFNSLNQL